MCQWLIVCILLNDYYRLLTLKHGMNNKIHNMGSLFETYGAHLKTTHNLDAQVTGW